MPVCEEPYDGPEEVFVTGAVANWQDRVADLLTQKEVLPTSASIYAGNRVMANATEQANPRVQKFAANHGRNPKEHEYAEAFIQTQLAKHHAVRFRGLEENDGAKIAARYAGDKYPLYADLRVKPVVTCARVANAGIQLGLQLRKAMREISPGFDADPSYPQLVIRTDTFPIARTPEQVDDAAHYQSPYTALRQVVLTAKLLEEAAADDLMR